MAMSIEGPSEEPWTFGRIPKTVAVEIVKVLLALCQVVISSSRLPNNHKPSRPRIVLVINTQGVSN